MKFIKATSGNVFHGLTEDETNTDPVIELVISVGEKKTSSIWRRACYG
jgi:hypothetical protein